MLKGNAFKWQGFARDQSGQIKFFHLHLHILCPRQIKKLGHQISHAFIFISYIIQPFIGAELS